jgi:PAS domain S-box-containing protein
VRRGESQPDFQANRLAEVLVAAGEAAIPVDTIEQRLRALERELAEARATIAGQQQLLRVGHVVSIVSRELGSLEANELDVGIERALGAFATQTHVDVGMVCLFSRDRAFMEVTHAWPPAPAPAHTPSPGLSVAHFAWTVGQILALEAVHVPSVADLPAEASGERALCARGGLRSVLFVPLVHRSEAIGFLSFASIAAEHTWTEGEIALTRMVADLFAGALARGRSSGDWAKVFECLRSLGADSRANIERLTALVGEILGGTCALYHRLLDGKLHAWGRWRIPADVAAVHAPEGHVCNDVIHGSKDELVVIRDLPSSTYAESDPDVRAHGLLTYVGRAVRAGDARVGALSVVFQRDFAPSPEQRRIFDAIADAVAVEEVRKSAHEALQQAVGELEATLESTADGILVADRTARPLRQNRKFLEMWRVPPEIVDDQEAVGRHRLLSVKNPAGFLMKVAELFDDDTNDDLSTIELNDGRIFERFSIPLHIAGEHRGRVWSVRDVTERTRREAELRHALALLEATLEATADGILVADSTGRELRANRRFREMWRTEPEGECDVEELARRRLRLVKDPVGFVHGLLDLYADDERADFATIELCDGRVFERYSLPLRVGGEARGRVTSYRDVTERAHRDAELRHTMAMLEATFEATADGVLAVDAQGRPLRYNRRFLEVWGIPPSVAGNGDGVAMLHHAVSHLRGLDLERDAWLRLAADPHASEFTTLELGDGRVVERYSIPLAVGGGHVGRVFSFRDVTERARGEASRALLATAVEQAGEAVVITDRDGAIEYVNPTFERMSGHRLEDVRGQTPRVLRSERHDVDTYRALWATISSGATWSGRLVNRRADGTLFEVDEVIAPVRTADGTIGSYVGILRDVTREHQLEEEVRQAQKMEAVGRLAGGIAHDFNNLLTAMIGYAEIIDAELDGKGPIAEDVREIRRAADRAANLTRQLLAFSRRQVLQPRVLDLNEVLANMEKMLRRLIPESVVVRTSLHASLRPIKADPGQVEQVVLNLALNARDAIADAGRLTLATENVSLERTTLIGHDAMPPGEYVRLSVTDDGHGMDAATLARVFEPFFTTKGVGKGTGLGLATVYGIVRQSGGAIQVESRLGAGTTFQLFFPVSGEVERPAACAAAPVPRSQAERTLLLVEDEAGVRAVAAKVLRAQGYRVLEAGDGVEALALAQAHGATIDAVITDVVMPRMGGPELVRHLCALRPALPMLFMSGHVDASVSGRELPTGAAFLPKPFVPEALRRAVHDLLAPREG